MHRDRTLVRVVDLRDELEQGRLAAAVAAHNAEELALVHLERDVFEHLLQFVALDALRPVDEGLLEAGRLFGGQFERFAHVVHVEHHGLLLVVGDAHCLHSAVLVELGHHITSANLRLLRRKTYTPNHSSTSVTTNGNALAHGEWKVFQIVGWVAGAMKLCRMS